MSLGDDIVDTTRHAFSFGFLPRADLSCLLITPDNDNEGNSVFRYSDLFFITFATLYSRDCRCTSYIQYTFRFSLSLLLLLWCPLNLLFVVVSTRCQRCLAFNPEHV